MKKIVLLASVFVLFSVSMLGTRLVTPAKASATHHVYPGELIQEAINSAQPGDTIFVHAGTYYEHVFVNKPLTLVGEDSGTTIIDGGGTWTVVRSNASDVEIRGFTIQNGGDSPHGGIQIASCVRNAILDNVIRNNGVGIELHESDDNVIVGNRITNSSWAGIYVRDSNDNDVHANMIVDNALGVWITSASSTFNKLYRNNFRNNSNHAQSSGLNTKWDNGAEGNYWDDYSGKDSDGDGIGDTLYTFYFDADECPLMEPWSLFRTFTVVPWNQKVTTFCNATVASFKFDQSLIQISFNVTGPSGAISFCNVTIPNELIWGIFTVLVNGAPIDPIPTSNFTHNSFYFTIEFQSTSRVKIKATEVVPEFPTWTSMLLVLIVLTVAIAIYERKLLKTSTLKTNLAQT